MSNDGNTTVFVGSSVGQAVDQVTEGCWFNPCYDGMSQEVEMPQWKVQ